MRGSVVRGSLMIVCASLWATCHDTPGEAQSRRPEDDGFMARKERTTMFIHRVHSEISKLQNPEDCTLARLLLVDYEAEALRSVEAFLIRLSSALAEAFFSNRTLLLGPTPFFPNQPIRACGASGSLHECFFLPLGRCSVDDLREEELYQLSVSTRAARPPNSSVKSSPGMKEWISELSLQRSGYDDASRAKWSEPRRALLALFAADDGTRGAPLCAAAAAAAARA